MLIDNLEDGDGILQHGPGAGAGHWGVGNDGLEDAGTQTPSPTETFTATRIPLGSHPGAGSKFCAFTAATGFQYAQLYIQIDDTGPYDASNTKGIGFWVRSDNPSYVGLTVSDKNTDPVHGVCTTHPEGCGGQFYTDVYLSPTWTWKEVYWANFKQGPGGYQAPAFASDAIYRIAWTAKPGSLNIWIDDPSFILK